MTAALSELFHEIEERMTSNKLTEEEAGLMVIVLRIWYFTISNNSTDELKYYIRRDEQGKAYFHRGTYAEEIPMPEEMATTMLTPEELIFPAITFVTNKINENLAPTPMKLSLLQDGSGLFRPDFTRKLSSSKEYLWSKIAFYVSDGFSFMPCKRCKSWFSLSPQAPKTRIAFCSDSCRVQACRHRQDRARQLAAAGNSFESIAKEIGSDLAIVKRWITGNKD